MQKKIDTYTDLGLNKYSKQRADYTIEFILQHVEKIQDKRILDIGDPNAIGKYISEILCVPFYNTDGDLDYYYIAPETDFNVVLCLEVIEHLMSPKYFLIELRKYITKDATIIFSYPRRPKWNWSRYHFNEYDEPRFRYLLDQCGYAVIDWQIRKYPESFRSKYLLGVRPFIRSFFERNNLVAARLK